MNYWYVIVFVVTTVGHFEAVPSEECEMKPKDTHCIIEYASRERFPHSKRYIYDWATRKCFLIRWSEHCPPPAPNVNNFSSESDCLRECSGWA